jgi:hypothetical protein
MVTARIMTTIWRRQILAGRSLEAFLNEKRSQEAKNKVRKIKTLTEHTPKQIYDFAIF